MGLGGAGSGGEVRPWSSAVELGGGDMRETKFRDHFWVSGRTVNWGGERGQEPDGAGGLIVGVGGSPLFGQNWLQSCVHGPGVLLLRVLSIPLAKRCPSTRVPRAVALQRVPVLPK